MDRLSAEEFEEAVRYETWLRVRAHRRGEERKLAERAVLVVCVLLLTATSAVLAASGDKAAALAVAGTTTALAGLLVALARSPANDDA
ncbi:MAG TPA: hypothetical protein VF529_06865 [Solirubrobacteraceae bacterium]|jgi:predicted phage tail protein